MTDADFSMFQGMLDKPNSVEGVFARFYDKTVKTEEIGEGGVPVFEKICFVEIKIKDQRDIYDQPADAVKKKRFAQEYARYELEKKQKLEGTPIEMYAFLDREQADSLNLRGIFTVEALAGISKEQAIDLGILKEKELADAFLNANKNNKAIVDGDACSEELAKLKEDMAAKDAAHTEELAKLKEELATKDTAHAEELAKLKEELKKLKKE